MDHGLATFQLVKAIQEQRLAEAQRRREVSLRQVRKPRSQSEIMRMALGPGTQFAGITERIIDTVTGPRAGSATR